MFLSIMLALVITLHIAGTWYAHKWAQRAGLKIPMGAYMVNPLFLAFYCYLTMLSPIILGTLMVALSAHGTRVLYRLAYA